MDAQYYREPLEENLRLHRPELMEELRSSGELESYLQETAEEAANEFNRLVRDILEKNPLPQGYLERVSRIAQVNQQADEVVRQNLIQLPDSDTEKAIRQGGYRD